MAEETTATTDDQNAAEVATEDKAQEADNSKPERSAESYQQELEKIRKESARYRTERNELRADAEKYRETQDAEKPWRPSAPSPTSSKWSWHVPRPFLSTESRRRTPTCWEATRRSSTITQSA